MKAVEELEGCSHLPITMIFSTPLRNFVQLFQKAAPRQKTALWYNCTHFNMRIFFPKIMIILAFWALICKASLLHIQRGFENLTLTFEGYENKWLHSLKSYNGL